MARKKIKPALRCSLAFAAIGAAGLFAAAPAWACTAGTAQTAVNPTDGPPGQHVTAYTQGSTLLSGSYDLYFLTPGQVHSHPASSGPNGYHHFGAKIAGPVPESGGNISTSVAATIPGSHSTSLGAAAVYFGNPTKRSRYAKYTEFLVN
ncbi:MAG: hypothetical protein ACRDX8_01065 [Acidimicrobiales bacterium]